MNRKALEKWVWNNTHRDYKGISNGQREVLTFITGKGTCSVALAGFTNEELLDHAIGHGYIAGAFTLDNQPVADIYDFIATNELTKRDIGEIRVLSVGETVVYGGGAAAEYVLRRVA